MAIGIKVDPSVLVTGVVVKIEPHEVFRTPEEKLANVPVMIDRDDVTIYQESGAAVAVRFRKADNITLPSVGDFVALEARVSETMFEGRAYVSLAVMGYAYDQLDQIQSKLAS